METLLCSQVSGTAEEKQTEFLVDTGGICINFSMTSAVLKDTLENTTT